MNTFFGKKAPFMVALLVLLILGPYGDSRVSAIDRSTYKSLKTFSEVLDMVEKNYVEPVETDKLLQGAINGMIKSLDPHSSFMTAEMFKELEMDTRGSFEGIGTEIDIVKGVLTIVSPIEDTPAYNAGVKAGDQIIRIDGKSTKDITIMEAVKKLRGAKGTKVTITIMREGLAKPKDIELTRNIIPVRSIKSKVYDDQIGYIRIVAFQERTGNDLKKALREIDAKAHPLKGIVLDLRNNPGGLLNQSVEVSDAFLKTGIIVSTRGRSKNMESKAVARDDGEEPTCPIVVLVNEGTASAAEIVSGALQDNGRAVILGAQTFGKASVQTVIPLEDGAALKLTTAKYYTPRGRSIQAEGITPDIVVKQIRPPEEKAEEKANAENHVLREKDLKGHIQSPTENNVKADNVKKETDNLEKDNQLKNAIDILKGWDILKKNMKG
ncbi:MAG: peptidase S41 [Syntrophobacterales bacterium CG_4_8_14_3_um_filter_58_8]|nr:MAG: peptidase S41 [Syntrophaceae bacterium CG2_30_58_14]PIV00608.1 MAG: peptidase S41 [Syntrophobacterales bacterium CG03_land_8_20_14_0_80_58_14]PJC72248.1 MAG: peptidase S41 [Syntrophobacterales bacterium CG_4_8_14_3_um_filter_58_8]